MADGNPHTLDPYKPLLGRAAVSFLRQWHPRGRLAAGLARVTLLQVTSAHPPRNYHTNSKKKRKSKYSFPLTEHFPQACPKTKSQFHTLWSKSQTDIAYRVSWQEYFLSCLLLYWHKKKRNHPKQAADDYAQRLKYKSHIKRAKKNRILYIGRRNECSFKKTRC